MSRYVRRLLTVCLLASPLLAGCMQPELTEDTASRRAPVFMAEEGGIADRYIVVMRDQAGVAAAMRRLAASSGAVGHTYSIIPGFSARLSPSAVAELRQSPDVLYIEQDRQVEIETVTAAGNAGIDRVDQRELPLDGSYDDHGNDGAGVHVHIVDTGILSTHSEVAGRVAAGVSTLGGSTEDCNGHGTYMASLAAGTLYGTAKQAILHPVRVLDCNGAGSYSNVISGIDWVASTCATNGWACVATMGLGGPGSTSLDDAVENAVAAGVTVVVSAGGSAADACNYSPARVASAITVAAIDDDGSDDTVASFSNHGPCVDIFAPGVNIQGAGGSLSGTTPSAALVAGVAAQYLQAYPGATPAQVAQGLLGNGTYDCITPPPMGAENVIVHNDFSAGAYYCPNCGAGYCGTQTRNGCWCDSWCTTYGDCCPDKIATCGP